MPYKRSKRSYVGGNIGSYGFTPVSIPDNIENDDVFNYFIENEEDILNNIITIQGEHTPSVSVLYDDMEDRDTNILMGIIGDVPYYVCYVTDGNTTDVSLFHPITENTRDSIVQSRIIYLDFLRKCRQINGLDALRYVKSLVRDPAFAVPIGVFLLVQKARRIRNETVDEEFNKPSYHRKRIVYNAYEILPDYPSYLTEDPNQESPFWDSGFKIDIDDIFALCKREIDFSYLSKSLTIVKKNARVVVVFGNDEKGNMKGIRVLIISGEAGTKNINYWGKFACADGLGAIIQKKSIEILRMELAYLATTVQEERRDDNLGPILRSWTNPNYTKTKDYQLMRFRAIKSAVPFWQYLGYSVYKLTPKGDAFFEARALPSDSSSRKKLVKKRQDRGSIDNHSSNVSSKPIKKQIRKSKMT